MRIMIDASSLARTITGIENYTKNLVENLIELNEKNNDELYILFRGEVPSHLKNLKSYTPLVFHHKSQLICEQLWIPYIYYRYRPDVIHFPAFPPSLLLISKKIYFTVHDATMWKYPETLSLKNKLYMRPLTNIGIKKAKKILTVSKSSLENIQDVFPNIFEKIENLGNSISPSFRQEENADFLKIVRDKYELPEKFFLTVGSLEPRKNLKFLIESFIVFKKNMPNQFKLVITGRAAWGSQELKETIRLNNLKNEVIFTGYLPDEELNALYTLAEAFLFPSIYEGFGLPVLEAMSCGTPVIISNTSSLPEVAGDAALYFDPKKQEELIEQLKNYIIEPHKKKELSEKGLSRKNQFSWKLVAERIYKAYKG